MTINDLDNRYYSQYFRRYGQNITEREIEELSLLGTVLSPLRKNPTPIQIVADFIGMATEHPLMYSFVAAQVFLSFMSELLSACNRSEDSVSHTVLRNKLSAVSEAIIAGSNHSLNGIEHLLSNLTESYRLLDFIQDNTTAPLRRIPSPVSGIMNKEVIKKILSVTALPAWLYPIIPATIASVLNGDASSLFSRSEVQPPEEFDLAEAGFDDVDIDDDGEIQRFKEKVRAMDQDGSARKEWVMVHFEDV